MKKILLAMLAAALSFAAVSCGGMEDIFDPTDPYGDFDDTLPILEGNSFTYGDHYYTLTQSGTGAEVSFTHFPSNVREFSFLQSQLLGKTKPGALALELMAFEMYRRNRTAGKACIEMCNLSANAKSVINQLSQKFPESRDDATFDESVCQPYLVATYLKGATQQNSYKPDYPYVLSLYENTSTFAKQGEKTAFGLVYRWCVKRGGEREVEASLILPYDEEVYLVQGCPDFFNAAAPAGTWSDDLK